MKEPIVEQPDADQPHSQDRDKVRSQKLEPLSPLTRILIMVLGWLLMGVGVLGLVLPGLQGILTLMLGAACISLVDHRALSLLRKIFRRWPKGWRRLLKLRRKMHGWLAPTPDDR